MKNDEKWWKSTIFMVLGGPGPKRGQNGGRSGHIIGCDMVDAPGSHDILFLHRFFVKIDENHENHWFLPSGALGAGPWTLALIRGSRVQGVGGKIRVLSFENGRSRPRGAKNTRLLSVTIALFHFWSMKINFFEIFHIFTLFRPFSDFGGPWIFWKTLINWTIIS